MVPDQDLVISRGERGRSWTLKWGLVAESALHFHCRLLMGIRVAVTDAVARLVYSGLDSGRSAHLLFKLLEHVGYLSGAEGCWGEGCEDGELHRCAGNLSTLVHCRDSSLSAFWAQRSNLLPSSMSYTQATCVSAVLCAECCSHLSSCRSTNGEL
ncbi:hypothetical protein Tco_1107881 [Tanacetum coccineum]